jgi:hypothetical protein
MKNILALLLSLLFVIPVYATITKVQSPVSADYGTVSTPQTLIFGSAITAGSTILVCVRGSGSFTGSTLSVTDDKSNSYTLDTSMPAISGTGSLFLYRASNVTGGGTTLTITPGTSTSLRVAGYEISGLAASSPLDKTAHASGNSISLASGSITTTQANEFVLGCLMTGNDIGSNPMTAGSGWTSDININTTNAILLAESQIVSSTGTFNATASIGTADTWGALVASYGATSGGGSCTHSGRLTSGSLAVPNGTSGSYVLANGSIGTPDCSSKTYPNSSGGVAVN